MGSDGTTDITRRLAMQAFEEMQSAPDRLAEAHRTIASQAEEIARLTAERDEACVALSDVAAVAEQIANDDRWDGGRRATASLVLHTMQMGNQKPWVCGHCNAALANLGRMTERHARLRVALVAAFRELDGVDNVASRALAADDDSGGEG